MVLLSFLVSGITFLLGAIGIVTVYPAIFNMIFEFFNNL